MYLCAHRVKRAAHVGRQQLRERLKVLRIQPQHQTVVRGDTHAGQRTIARLTGHVSVMRMVGIRVMMMMVVVLGVLVGGHRKIAKPLAFA
jgi:hypothetical protein